MAARAKKKSNISLSTWGHRGTAGLVEEWESRIPLPEKKPKSRRHSGVSPQTSADTASGPQE